MLDRLSRIVHGHRDGGDVDQAALDSRPPVEKVGEEARGVSAGAPLPDGTENDRDVQRSWCVHGTSWMLMRE
jgi:hypothetical protein